MTARAKAPALDTYVVRTGLTSRLVRARDAEHAEQLFLASIPIARHLKRGPGAIVIRRSIASDLEAFGRRRARPPETMALDLDPDTTLDGAPFVR